jgi:hypothetical protein
MEPSEVMKRDRPAGPDCCYRGSSRPPPTHLTAAALSTRAATPAVGQPPVPRKNISFRDGRKGPNLAFTDQPLQATPWRQVMTR